MTRLLHFAVILNALTFITFKSNKKIANVLHLHNYK